MQKCGSALPSCCFLCRHLLSTRPHILHPHLHDHDHDGSDDDVDDDDDDHDDDHDDHHYDDDSTGADSRAFSVFSFLAVQNSSIGDLVTDSLTN